MTTPLLIQPPGYAMAQLRATYDVAPFIKINKQPHNCQRCSHRSLRWEHGGAFRAGPNRLATRVHAVLAAPAEALDITKMTPLNDRLLVQPLEVAQKSAGGILLATTGKEDLEEAQIGQVLAIGEDADLDVKVGDTILFVKYSTSDIETPEGKLRFVAAKSVLATLS
eukprot:jgi/Botrbrau1/16023/Bobra.0268s0005.1